MANGAGARGKKTLLQRIALEGGEEFLKELKDLGLVGETFFKDLQKAAAEVKGPPAAFGRFLATARHEFRQVGSAAREFRRSLDNVGSAATRVARNVALVGAAAAGAATAVFALAKSSAGAADEQRKQSQALGLSISEYGRLQFALEQSGVSTDKFVTSMTRLNVRLGEALEGGKTSTELFARLGVEALDATGKLRPTSDILGDLAAAFQALPDGAEKSALAVELFGRTGAQMIPLLNAGREGLRAFGEEAERMGLVLTEAQGRMGEDLNDALNLLRRTAGGARIQLGLLFAPAITRGATALTEVFLRQRAAIEAFVAGVVEHVVPVIDDLFALIEGRDRDIQNAWIVQIRDAVVEFGEAVAAAVTGIVVPALEALLAVANTVADAINAVFGTEFTGRQVAIAAAVMQLVGVFNLLAASIGAVRAAALLVRSVLFPIIAFAGPGAVAIATAAAFGAVVVKLVRQQGEAGTAAEQHAEAMERLEGAIEAVKNATPETIDAVKELAREQLAAAEAALAATEAQLAQASAIGAADVLNPSAARQRLAEIVPALQKAVDEQKAKVAELRQAIESAVPSATDANRRIAAAFDLVGDGAAGAGRKVDELGQKVEAAGRTSRVHLGSGDVREFQVGAAIERVGEAAEEAGDKAEDAGRKIRGHLGGEVREIALTRQLEAAGEAAEGAGAAAEREKSPAERMTEALEAASERVTAFRLAAGEALDAIIVKAAETVEAVGELRPPEADWMTFGEAAAGAFAAITDAARGMPDALDAHASSVMAGVKSTIEGVADEIEAIARRLVAAMERVERAAKAALAAAQAAQSAGGSSGPALAGGGPVYGPGTSTSDSIWARLSNREYVHPTKAVDFYGLDFMESVRRLLFPRDIVRALLAGGRSLAGSFRSGGQALSASLRTIEVPALATGGFLDLDRMMARLAPQPALAFETGGQALAAPAPGRDLGRVTLQVGGERFDLLADADVFGQVTRYASSQARRAAGEPQWWQRR